jgi:hypothetical protein
MDEIFGKGDSGLFFKGDPNLLAEDIADDIDKFTASLFSMPLPTSVDITETPPAAAVVAEPAVDVLETPKLFQVPTIAAHAPRKPPSKVEVAREYRKLVAIPRYLDKRSRRKWNHSLMHPSRSAAANRRLRTGGKFEVAPKPP